MQINFERVEQNKYIKCKRGAMLYSEISINYISIINNKCTTPLIKLYTSESW